MYLTVRVAWRKGRGEVGSGRERWCVRVRLTGVRRRVSSVAVRWVARVERAVGGREGVEVVVERGWKAQRRGSGGGAFSAEEEEGRRGCWIARAVVVRGRAKRKRRVGGRCMAGGELGWLFV